MTNATPVSIVGGGTVGLGWAVVFAAAGFPVRLHETDDLRRSSVMAEMRAVFGVLHQHDLAKASPEEAVRRVSYPEALEEAVDGAALVVECVTESLEAKRAVFSDADRLASEDAVITSSSSSLTISQIAEELPGRRRCLLAHPANPPYLLPVVEIAPAAFTSDSAVQLVTGLLQEAGMIPIRIRAEIEGLVYNRLQGAVLREAYCLVRDGVITASDLDRLVTDGLGRRWSIIGPFATAHLNTRGGIVAHAARLGDAYARMGAERGQSDPWTKELVTIVAHDLSRRFPLEEWESQVRARDEALMALNQLMRSLERPGQGDAAQD